MLPLAGSTPPTTADEFARALADGLRAAGLAPRAVEADGGAWPEVARLVVDLTGAEVTRATRLPVVSERVGAGVKVAEVELRASPGRFEKTPIHLSMRLAGVVADFERTADGALALALASAAGGELTAHISLTDLEAALHALAVALGAKQGVEAKTTRLEIEAPTPRSLVFRAAVTAKVFIMTTTVKVRGRVDLDEQLNARVSGLVAEGEGMMAGMVESALRPRLAKIEAQTFALGAFVTAGLHVSDATVSVDDAMHLHATLGGA